MKSENNKLNENIEKHTYGKSLDEQMQQALNEDKLNRQIKDKKRKARRHRRNVIAVSIIIVIITGIVLILVNCLSSNVYKDEEAFMVFANDKIETNELYTSSGSTINYDYAKPLSVAVRKDDGINDNIREFRDEKINEIISSVTNTHEDVKTNEKSGAQALIIDTAAFRSSSGVISLYIHNFTYKQDEKDMVFDTANVETYLFDEKNMQRIEPLQALNVNYKDKASEYAKEYFNKKYNNDDIVEFYDDYTSATDNNLNKFFMTENDIVFVFDQHTVVSAELGIAEMAVPNSVIGSTIRPAILDRYIDPAKPMVAITYDDGPGDESETEILNTLAKNGSVATFFYLGNRVSNFSTNAKKAVKIGCEIGNHSWDHPMLSKLTTDEIINEITMTNSKILEVCGVEPSVARPPYGDFNKNVLKASNMAEVLWTVDTQDWKSKDAKKVFETVKKQKNLDGKIILMHSIYKSTAQATDKIVPWLKEQGYQTVTVSEMIKYKTGSTPKAGKLYRKMP